MEKRTVWGFFVFHPVTTSDFRNKEARNEGNFALGLAVGLSKIIVINEANYFLSSR